MLASTRPNQGKRGRRGIVLVLILGVLALMAVIGVAFATLSGQSRISARNFAQSVNQPQRDELMDYALEQLIGDTADIRSSIRGHSMARDMYGNDGNFNGYLLARPGGAGPAPYNYGYLYITGVTAVGTSAPTQYLLTTNILSSDPAFYGYNFTRWTMRVTAASGMTPLAVDQSLEILADNVSGTNRVFTVNINPTDAGTTLINPTLVPTAPYVASQLPGANLIAAAGGGSLATLRFVLDGRWLHAFNGPGMTTNAVHANFRYNQPFVASPNAAGMDEDYDAVDLENWFLAMQSADGSVMIPSFHRPAAIRVDPTNATNPIYDWGGPQNATWENAAPANWADSASRILRPRAADGHDASAFPDLVPDATGKITYDVDNDGDGLTDSVWVDLGYPARRNAQGQLYKPLFSFMVIGLNGRIPLNTAGNLAGGRGGNGASHAAHLGNSVSEVDPTYALQNGFAPGFGQADNLGAGTDVRLTQLRNLLAGTRTFDIDFNPTAFPYAPSPPVSAINGDANWVQIGVDTLGNPIPFYMPNGLVDSADVDTAGNSPPTNGQVMRSTQPVAGRWGESQSVPGNPTINPSNGQYINLLSNSYNNRIRAGYSEDVTDLENGIPRDAADDNYNSFDPFPAIINRGEIGDLDYYDPVGALLLPVERMRRYVTPADINGTGHIVQWDGQNPGPGADCGGDLWGRVEYSSYFRPPGLPGQVAPGPVGVAGTGVINFVWATNPNPPNPPVYPADMVSAVPNNNSDNNNPLHGFECQRFPNLNYPPPPNPPAFPTFSPQRAGGVPIDLPVGTPPPPATPYPILPTTLPTYDEKVNAHVNSDGLNEADEMNLYVPNPQLDSPFGYADLEWLYRQQDVDGSSLVSRLAKLAPISFRNSVDGQRRRRLFALDSWDLNSYSWANDNPATPAAPNGVFQYNARYIPGADAGFTTLNVTSVPPPGVAPANSFIAGLPNPTNAAPSPAFSLAHRDKKINLNYPLPVSNDPNEPIRQKWISDTYQTLKAILPPRAVDTPEELAQLSQYVINIIDFRDTDATMTHWVNPDVSMAVWNGTGAPVTPVLIPTGGALPANTAVSNTNGQFDQYGMEFNPIAINEVLAYSFLRRYNSTPTPTPRLFIELVNTLTSPEIGTPANNASMIDLSGFLSTGTSPTLPTTPWDDACWDIVFTDDNVNNRPDPYLGQLQPPATTVVGTSSYGVYGLLPLYQGAMVTPPGDLVTNPLPQKPLTAGGIGVQPFNNNYFMVIGNNLADFKTDAGVAETPPTNTPPYLFTIQQQYDPIDYTVTAAPPVTSPPVTPPLGVLPPLQTGAQNTNYPMTIPGPLANGTGKFYWVCLRRPANPFAPVSAKNPMIVVDSMRFPYIEGLGTSAAPVAGSPDTVTQGNNQIFSYQRLQPYRGGHAVPPASGTGIDTRYGYSEQVAAPTAAGSGSGGYGLFGTNPSPGNRVTQQLLHTLGYPNEGAFTGPLTATPTQVEPWEYFPFNDRDFTSVAELLLVPGCPPGLFTKQFAEFAPTANNVSTILSLVKPLPTNVLVPPATTIAAPTAPSTASNPLYGSTTPFTPPLLPHTFPYLVDKFFYTGQSPPPATTSSYGDPTGDGWFKMFEFFEVPSQMIGAIGPVAQGTNFDWLRQDTKPGQINLNLIIDEEVFFSVFGQQDQNFNQQLLNFYQLPPLSTPGWTGGAWPGSLIALTSPVPIVVTATNLAGAPTYAYPINSVGVVATDPVSGGLLNHMKASFAQFLSLRHGGSGFVFGYGSGLPGQNAAVLTNPANPYAPAPLTSPIPADRPFHSLSYPDINYTIMRPAALPPAIYSLTTSTDPPPSTLPTPLQWPGAYAGNYAADPGLRNPSLYQGFATTVPPVSNFAAPTPVGLVPPTIPARRLFQPPDANPTGTNTSNASEQGDPYINVTMPNSAAPIPPATGALAPLPNGTAATDGVVNLFWPNAYTPPTGSSNLYLGANANTSLNPPTSDMKQHPYFRTEMLQKAMNLTTVRTHQYAVWITIGFFEVKRQGDLLMLGTNPIDAFDILGPELGDASGQTTRYRGFFLVDRLQLTGYDPNVIGSFRPAVVYRQTIE